MERRLLYIFAILFLVGSMSAQPAIDWVKCDGGVGMESTWMIESDGAGNSYVIGLAHHPSTISNQPVSGTPEHFFLAKYDSNGQFQWLQTFKRIGISALKIDNSFLYICGSYYDTASIGGSTLIANGYSDAFIARFDFSGNVDMILTGIGSGTEVVTGIDIDGYGHIYATGLYGAQSIFNSDTLFGTTDHNLFLIKYDAAGNIQWKRTGTQTINLITGIDVSSGSTGSRIYVLGNVVGEDGIDSVFLSGADIYYHCNGITNYILLAYDSLGTLVNVTHFQKGNHHSVNGIDQDSFQNLFVAEQGHYSSFEFRKYDANLNLLWQKFFPFYSQCTFGGFAIDPENNIYTTGAINGIMVLETDTFESPNGDMIFLSKFDSSLTHQWTITSSSLTGRASGISINSNQDIFFTGSFVDSLNLQSYSCVSNGWDDFFIAKINGSTQVGLKEQEGYLNAAIVYPNPSKGIFQINYHPVTSISYSVTVFNVLGKKIFSGSMQGEVDNTIDLSKEPNGIYFLEIHENDKRVIKKIAIE